MTDKSLLFPKNFERYLALGHEAYERQEWEIAKENFLAAYQLKQDFEANFWLVKSLIMLEEWAQALEYVNEISTAYTKTAAALQVYIQVLKENFAFVSARKVLNWCKRQKLYLTEITKLIDDIAEMEAAFCLVHRAKREQAREKFVHFASLPPIMQLGLLKNLELPLADVLELVKKYLAEEQIHPFIRHTFLLLSCEIGITETLTFRSVTDKTEIYVPSELLPLEEMPHYQMIFDLAEKHFADQDPVFWQSLKRELPLQLLLCYPNLTEMIPSIENWLQAEEDWYQRKELVTQKTVEYKLLEKIQMKLQTVFNGI